MGSTLWLGLMRSMETNRRRFVLSAFGGALAWPLNPFCLNAAVTQPVYLSARGDQDGRYWVSGFTQNGQNAFDLPLPARGHSFAIHPRGQIAVHFARRPNTFAYVIDVLRGRVVNKITTPEGRHFYGHGMFSPDGQLLYTTENDFEAERGVIGVYDASAAYKRVGELPAHGIGPHELSLLSDGITLAIAIGGILTRPDLPRLKLNVATMAPALVYVDRRDGRLLHRAQLAPELHQLSIRHLSVGEDDTVGVAMQYEGPTSDSVPLVGYHRGQGPLQVFEPPAPVTQTMKNYCGSATFDSSGQILAVSAPRGNIVTFWDTNAARYLTSLPVPDGCGIASGLGPGRFLASSGRGGVFVIDAPSGNIQPLTSPFLKAAHWDNHMMTTQICQPPSGAGRSH